MLFLEFFLGLNFKMGRNKKGQAVVLDTNVKILIVVIVIVVVLSGIFLFGDKIFMIYDNFVPKTNVPDLPDEIIPEEKIEYDFSIPEEIDVNQIRRETLLFSEINALLSNTIIEVRRDGKTIVRSNFNPTEDLNPKTEKIEILLKNLIRNDIRIELIYNAKENRVESKLFKGGSEDFSSFFCRDNLEGIRELNSDEQKALKNVICAKSLSDFISNVVRFVREESCLIKINEEFVESVSKGISNEDVDAQKLFLMLKEIRPNYFASWGKEGSLAGGKINTRYSCDIGNSFVPCTFDTFGKFLEVKYQPGDEIFYLKGKEIWRIIYPEVDGILVWNLGLRVENHCISSIEKGAKCQ